MSSPGFDSFDRDLRARPNGPSPGAAFAHRQPFLSIEPADAVDA
jgi:hypothetical protein